MFVISRIEQYKFSDCAAVFAESERKLARYDNPDWNPDKTPFNHYFAETQFSCGIENYILFLKQKYKCRLSIDPSLPLNKQTNCFCQALFTASPELLKSLTREEQIEFFRHCYDFFLSKFPSVEVLSAVVHFDESNAHMHLNFIPICRKANSKGKIKTGFNSSELFSGKDFFVMYQDEFFDYMRERYPDWDLERKGEVHQDHLTVREYKKIKSQIEQVKEEHTTALVEVERLQSVIDEVQPVVEEIESIDSLGEEPVFGKRWKIDFEALDYLKSAAKNYFEGLLIIRRLRKQNEELRDQLENEKTKNLKLIRDNVNYRKENQILHNQKNFLLRFIESIQKMKELDDFVKGCERSTRLNAKEH